VKFVSICAARPGGQEPHVLRLNWCERPRGSSPRLGPEDQVLPAADRRPTEATLARTRHRPRPRHRGLADQGHRVLDPHGRDRYLPHDLLQVIIWSPSARHSAGPSSKTCAAGVSTRPEVRVLHERLEQEAVPGPPFPPAAVGPLPARSVLACKHEERVPSLCRTRPTVDLPLLHGFQQGGRAGFGGVRLISSAE